MLTTGVDREARVWDLGSHRLLSRLRPGLPEGEAQSSERNGVAIVAGASFSPDGQKLVIASYDHLARIYTLSAETRSPRAVARLVQRLIPFELRSGGALLPRPAPQGGAPARSRPGQSVQVATRQAQLASRPRATHDLPTAHARPVLQSYRFRTVRQGARGQPGQESSGEARFFREDLGQGVHLDMVAVPAGQFTMGSRDPQGQNEELPRHPVSLPAFFVGKFEVTQAQWRAVMGDHRFTFHDRDDLPVESVTWHEAMEFCERLSRLTGRSYRLPSDAEWEYACRAGTDTEFAHGDAVSVELVNIDPHDLPGPQSAAYRRRTTPVGSLGVANAFGLYDMHGNVFEWCLDPFHDHYRGAPADGSAWEGGAPSAFRVLRGGSWRWTAYYARSAYRRRLSPNSWGNDLGFRVVLSAAE
jgi:formylglycine-generating enzyme required for sulfatase activity